MNGFYEYPRNQAWSMGLTSIDPKVVFVLEAQQFEGCRLFLIRERYPHLGGPIGHHDLHPLDHLLISGHLVRNQLVTLPRHVYHR